MTEVNEGVWREAFANLKLIAHAPQMYNLLVKILCHSDDYNLDDKIHNEILETIRAVEGRYW